MTDRIVYLIEDDDAARDSTAFLLDVNGFKVQAFSDAEEFLGAVLEPVSPILADVTLPGMSGLQLLRHLRKSGCSAPIILISAHGDQDTENQAKAAGAVCLLQKPVPSETLIEIVRRCCNVES